MHMGPYCGTEITSHPFPYPDFYAPAASARWGYRAFGLSVCPWTRLRFLSKVESQDLLMPASWYFIWWCISVRPAGEYTRGMTYYLTVRWLRTLAKLSRLGFLSKVESQDLLMLASWYFIWECISMWPAGLCRSHDLLTYISRSADFRL